MKKSYLLMASLLVAGSLASCGVADDFDSKSAQTQGQQEIKFTTGSDITRGTATNVTAANSLDNFKLWAFKTSDHSAYISATAYDWNSTEYATSSPAYWPESTTNLDFIAVYPKSATLTGSTPAASASWSTINYTASTTNAEQIDLMATIKKSQNSSTNSGTVDLKFRHLLSWVTFKAKVSASIKVTILELSVCNIQPNGVFDLSSLDDNDLTKVPSVTAGGTAAEYPLTLATAATDLASSTATNIAATGGDLLLIPQTLTPWGTNKTTPVALANNYIKAKIVVKSPAGDELYTSVTDPGNPAAAENYIYLPISAPDGAWKTGKKYVYTLNFGSTGGSGSGIGYDEDGNPEDLNATAVTLTTSIVEWDTTPAPDDLVF